MFGKWLEEYQKLSQKTRFISQLGAFLIALFAKLSLYDKAYYLHINNYLSVKGFSEFDGLFTSVIFQTIVLIIFALRFVLLFFKSEKTFNISQFLWLFGLIIIAIYWYISRPEPGPFGFYEMIPTPIFSYASKSFEKILILYLILSLLKKIVIITIALIKSKRIQL